nr:ABC transporter permease subunit [Diplocloster modestus]
MIAPAVLFFLVFNYGPMVGIYYAFTQYSFGDGLLGSPFVGLTNFKILLQNGSLGYLTRNTVLYNLVFIVVGNVLEVLVAVLIHRLTSSKFKKFSQSVILFPYVISFVIVQVFAYAMLNGNSGALTHFIREGLGASGFNAYTTPSIWKYVIVLVYLWKHTGYGMIIYLAALSGISRDYYEAAQIDGATAVQQIRYITLPQLVPTFITLLLLAIGNILRGQFELFYQLVGTNGLLYEQTDIFDTFVFRLLQNSFDVGLGTAAGLYQSFFGLVVVLACNYFVKRSEPGYALF